MGDLNSIRDFRLVTPNAGNNALGDCAEDVANGDWRGDATLTRQSGLPLWFADAAPVLPRFGCERDAALKAKRVFDVVVAGAALLGLAPLLLIVALLIKVTSRGPVFFRQQREGLNGAVFEVLKFRSMPVDDCDLSGVDQTVTNDPRLSPIGRTLRKISIDELPQLINVLRGDMSLVGPRPHVPGMRAAGVSYRDLVPYYDLRLQILPGLTGWAQANGLRGDTSNAWAARARIDHDAAYIRHFSLWLDIKIIIKTTRNEVFGGSGN